MLSPFLRRPKAWRAFALALHVAGVAVILVLSLSSASGGAAPGNDKLHHFAAYFAVALTGYAAAGRRGALAVLIWMAGLGAGLEWAQGALTDFRTPDAGDLAANLLGAIAAYGVWRGALALWRRCGDAPV